MKLLAAFLCLGIAGHLFGGESNYSFAFLDNYLTRWNRFANGDNSLVPFIRENTLKFEKELAAALSSGDKRAPSRVVFYAVVKVGGFIDSDSALGKEVRRVFVQLPITNDQKGKNLLFAGDLYFWWKEKHGSYAAFTQYDEWETSDFARKVTIPMYERVHAQQKKER